MKKECRIEAGAYADFYFSYTPKMKINRHMFANETFLGPPNTPSDVPTPTGYYYWKGLNHRGVMVESRGVQTQTNIEEPAGIYVGNTTGITLIRATKTFYATLEPLKMSANYTHWDSQGLVGNPEGAHTAAKFAYTTIPTTTTVATTT